MTSGGLALVVGGTGPTGPHVVAELAARGYEVTLLHRGLHDDGEADADGLEHIHADPHFAEPLSDALRGRQFEVVIAAYGRLAVVADALAGRCRQFVGVTGVPVYPGYLDPAALWPAGMAVPTQESDAVAAGDAFAAAIRSAEQHLLALDRQDAFAACVVRYASIYGPRQVYPREWSVVRRVLDGRDRIILADGGLTINARCAARNAAALIASCLDRFDLARGETFNAADDRQYTLRQWVQLVSAAAGRELDIVSLPFGIAGPGRGLFPLGHADHVVVSTQKARDLLGHVDAIPARQALADAARWLVEHPPDPRTQALLSDPFDYQAEDALVDAYTRAIALLPIGSPPPGAVTHPYAHPRSAGGADHRGR